MSQIPSTFGRLLITSMQVSQRLSSNRLSSGFCRVSSMSPPVLKDATQQTFVSRLVFNPSDSQDSSPVELEAVYQDTQPSGSSTGTVVTLHGSPGSHKDFKYITPLLTERGIRVIGVNYPGFGLSQDHTDLKHSNTERNAYVQALIDGLKIEKNIVFMGHSRGTENAVKMSALNVDKTIGTVMVNPTGLRKHKGIRPFAIVSWTCKIYDSITFIRGALEYFLHKVYNWIGLRLDSGRIAINSLKSMHQIALERQQPYMEKIMDNPHIRVLFCFAGKDFLVESEISREYAEMLRNREALKVTTRVQSDEDETSDAVRKAFVNDNRQSVSVEFTTDGHFLQKFRSRFIANAIIAICEAAANDSKKGIKP